MAKRILERFKKLNKKKKIQLVAATALTAALLVALPLYAWFTHTRSIAMKTKINAPTQLYITAGNKESVANLEMGNIDVESETRYKDFVFGISGKYVSKYQIQLAHTTNIPFTYKIYRASSVENAGADTVEYVSEDSSKHYYQKGEEVQGDYINQDSTTKIANDSLHDKSYDEYSKENVQQHAEALYWQSTKLDVENKSKDSNDFVDYFIIRVSWDDKVENDKETDMVYLTVQRVTQ